MILIFGVATLGLNYPACACTSRGLCDRGWCPFIYVYIYVIGYGKTAHFAHYFKIKLLVFKGSVDLKQ